MVVVPTGMGRSVPLALIDSYRECRRLARAHGRSYYVATWLLPRFKQPHVHALYAFCRYADDIVDELSDAPLGDRRAALHVLGDRFFAGVHGEDTDDRILPAVVHTVRTFGIDIECFQRFLGSMSMDLEVSTYGTFDDLLVYMDGSAAAIGEMMLPILAPASDRARQPARDLGIAFQLTNFIRDVGEDLIRQRVYLPQRDIRRFGAATALRERRVTAEWVDLLRYQIDRAWGYYESAGRGIALLPASSACCVTAAQTLYSQILDRVAANGYDVFSRRARVPAATKLMVAARLSVGRGSE